TSRYALLTGRDAYRSNLKTEVTANWAIAQMIDSQRQTLGNLMQRAGYTTQALGKWGVNNAFYDINGNPAVPVSSSPVSQAYFDSIRWPTAGNPNVESILSGPIQQGFDSYYGLLGNNQSGAGNLRVMFQNNTAQGVPIYNGGAIQTAGWDPTKTNELVANKM